MSQHHPEDHDDHDHEHTGGLKGWLLSLLRPHEHGHYAAALDPAMSNARGIWAVKVSLLARFSNSTTVRPGPAADSRSAPSQTTDPTGDSDMASPVLRSVLLAPT